MILNPIKAHHTLWFLVLFTLTACGYHFPGEQSAAFTGKLLNARIQISGPGAKKHPLLASILKENVETHLGITPNQSRNASQVIAIYLQEITHTEVLENRQGLAEQYKVQISASVQMQQSDRKKTAPEKVVSKATTKKPDSEPTQDKATKPTPKSAQNKATQPKQFTASGTTTYYESTEPTTSHTIRRAAESEALDNLADNLVSLLANVL
ncbi:hypothetical protein ACQZV8_08770 [Magnetococcales bacterium HHB-1]